MCVIEWLLSKSQRAAYVWGVRAQCQVEIACRDSGGSIQRPWESGIDIMMRQLLCAAAKVILDATE